MKKISFKKIIAIMLFVVLAGSVFAGCSLYEYQDDRDMQQTVLKVASFEMEYDMPLYVEDKDNRNEVIYYDNGKAVMKVLRDHTGAPIYRPAVEGGAVKCLADNGDPDYGVEKRSDGCYISYIFNADKTAVTGAEEYHLAGINQDKVAVWRNVDTYKNDLVYSKSFEITGTDQSGKLTGVEHTLASGISSDFPMVYYANKSGKPDAASFYYLYKTPIAAKGKWMTKEKEFTKRTLINYYGSSGSSLQENGYTIHETYDQLIRGIYTMYFLEIEAENYIKSGGPVWGLTEKNNVKKSFYNSINSALENKFQELYTEKGQTFDGGGAPEEEAATYPVEPGNTQTADRDYEEWSPDKTHYLGLGTHTERTSLVREGMRRWVTEMEDRLEYDYTVTYEQRKQFDSELVALRQKMLTTNGLDEIYPELLTIDENGDLSCAYDIVWYYYGEKVDANAKNSALKTYIGKEKTIDNNDVQNRYNTLLEEQKTRFNASLQNYYSAATGSDTILYFANDEYFFIKHILLPFSDEVQATLDAYEQSGNYSDEKYNEMRDFYGKSIKVYEHIDGKVDNSTQKTVDQAYAHIKSVVEAETTARGRERAFESMIYRYNTDPGIFNKETGYAVSKTSEANGGPAETYVIEFATAARELRNAYIDGKAQLGSITKPVLGKFGYHIISLLKVPGGGAERKLNDYLTEGEYSTVYDVLSANLLTAAQEQAYENWSSTKSTYYERETEHIKIYENRYKDLWDPNTNP